MSEPERNEIDILKKLIFETGSDAEFNQTALRVFRYQYEHNPVYRRYADLVGCTPNALTHFSQIPFLPVEFYKSQKVISQHAVPTRVFKSSGTSGQVQSSHYVVDEQLYQQSILGCFRHFYGNPEDYIIFGLVPSISERPDSSLAYMLDFLIRESHNAESGIYLGNEEKLHRKIHAFSLQKKKMLLIGLSYALLDMAEEFPLNAPDLTVVETGGMKGRREELIREQLHERICSGFGVSCVHSEYSMSELLSQAWSAGNGVFHCPPWMKVLVRDTGDPLSVLGMGARGGINIIDLANLYTCSFLAVQDIGTVHDDGSFEISGRFDNSDLRGCSLLLT